MGSLEARYPTFKRQWRRHGDCRQLGRRARLLAWCMLGPDKVRAEIGVIRQKTAKPIDVNFFFHSSPDPDPAVKQNWRQTMAPYYAELGLDSSATAPAPNRAPFDDEMCSLVEELSPKWSASTSDCRIRNCCAG